LLAYSKPAFEKAGLDPDHPPRAWAEFLAATQKLRAAGFVPWGYGVKGLTGIGNFNSLFILQDLDEPTDLLKVVTGEVPFTDPRYSGWLHRVEELVRKGAFNRDVSSLEYYQAQDLLLSGEAAMVVTGQAKVSAFIKALGEQEVGVMLPPRFGSGKLAGRMPSTTQQLLVTSWSSHKAEAADLLRYFHTSERLERMNALSGAIPPDDRFDRRKLRHPQDRTIAAWLEQESTTDYQDYWPPQMDRENLFLAVQSLFAGALSAEQAARQVEAFLKRWRDANPDMVKTLAAWASGAK
jgi:multiple sugar transport system substrate-binding protein